uniref:Uncharacterized protein n=1 Tax=Arundo donax TaxID=35708 RepID=A0A0A9C1U3_ARUDO
MFGLVGWSNSQFTCSCLQNASSTSSLSRPNWAAVSELDVRLLEVFCGSAYAFA